MADRPASTPPLPRVAAIVLAAGESRRMRGGDKLLRTVRGVPLVRRAALTALGSDCSETIVALQPRQRRRSRCIADLPVRITYSGQAFKGMGNSLQSGLAAVSGPADGVIVLLADMPEIESGDLNALIREFESNRIVAAGAEGLMGNPVLLPCKLFAELSRLAGDAGARTVISSRPQMVKIVNRPGRRALLDLDTPEDWDGWQQPFS